MAKKDKYLLNDNGEPYRTSDGNTMLIAQFGSDPSFNPNLDIRTLADVVDELHRLGICVPDTMLKRHNDIFLLDENGKPYRTKDGSPIQQAWFEKDVEIDEDLLNMTDEKFIEEMERLGLPIPDKIRP